MLYHSVFILPLLYGVRIPFSRLFSWLRFCVLANQSSVSLVLAMIEELHVYEG